MREQIVQEARSVPRWVGGIGAGSVPICAQQSHSRTFYCGSMLLLTNLLRVLPGESLESEPVFFFFLETQTLYFQENAIQENSSFPPSHEHCVEVCLLFL